MIINFKYKQIKLDLPKDNRSQYLYVLDKFTDFNSLSFNSHVVDPQNLRRRLLNFLVPIIFFE